MDEATAGARPVRRGRGGRPGRAVGGSGAGARAARSGLVASDGAAVLGRPRSRSARSSPSPMTTTTGRVAVGGPFDTVAVFGTSGAFGPRLLARRGWTYGLAWVADAPTLLASGQAGLAGGRNGAGGGSRIRLPGWVAHPRLGLRRDARASQAAARRRRLFRSFANGPDPGGRAAPLGSRARCGRHDRLHGGEGRPPLVPRHTVPLPAARGRAHGRDPVPRPGRRPPGLVVRRQDRRPLEEFRGRSCGREKRRRTTFS